MRLWLLLALLSIASAEDDAAAVNAGDWGFAVFLQFDANGRGAWGDAKAGAMARYEIVHTPGGVPDPVGGGGGRTKKREPEVSQREYRVVKDDDGKLALQTRKRAPGERGKPGKWGKAQALGLPAVDPTTWKIELVGGTTYDFGSRSVAATNYRVRVPGPQGEDVWLVTVNKELGTVRAKQESGDQFEWSLVRTDVEVKVGNAKLLCREYEFKCNPPEELKALVATERRMCLSAEVPGRVVRQAYSGFLGATWRVELISFRG